VAVKRVLVREEEWASVQARFRSEVGLMARLRHENVVRFLGASAHPDELCIVTEYVRKGSLARLLHASHAGMTLGDVLDVASGVAAALQYLHSRRVVHRDLTSANVLIDVDPETLRWVAKVADFGLSRTRDQTAARRSAGVATAHAASPELLAGRYDTPTDVWSFGVLLYELATRRVPFAGRHQFELVLAIHGGLTLEGDLPPDDYCHDVPGESGPGHFVTAGLRALMLDCWAPSPEKRPTAAELVERLGRESMTVGMGAGMGTGTGAGAGRGPAAAPAEPPQAPPTSRPIEVLDPRLGATSGACADVRTSSLRARIDS